MAALDPASVESQDEVEDSIDRAAFAAQMGVLAVVARRLGSIEDDTTYSDAAAWASGDLAAMASALSMGAAMVATAYSTAVDGMTEGNEEWAGRYYAATGAERASVAGIADDAKRSGRRILGAMMRVPVVGFVNADGTYNALPDAYRLAVDRAVAAMRSGRETYVAEIARAVSNLSRNGLRVRYESGTTRDLYAAVRTGIMDGYRDAMAAERLEHGKAFGADGVEVTAHGMCAPDHVAYQGKRYTVEEWRSKQYEPERPLVVGANCRHSVFPVIYGIGEPAHSAEELAELRELSEGKVSFVGLSGKRITCTRYEATQHKRRMELSIRKARAQAKLQELAGLEDEAKRTRGIASEMVAHYRSASEQMGLSTREERTRAYTAAR